MADERQPPSLQIDDDSDKEDLFASAKVDVDLDDELTQTTTKTEQQNEEKISPDSGCESAMAQSLLEEDEEKQPAPSSHISSDASAFYPEPTGSYSPTKVSAKEEEATGIQKKKTEQNRFPKDETEDPSSVIEILVSEPKKIGDGMNAYVVYKVTTRTNLKFFRSCEMTVSRRFSDFLGLHEKLVEGYQCRGKIIPQAPEKSVLGMTKVKMTKDETGSLDFVEKRRAALERFLNRIAKHPDLRSDRNFIDFLEVDGDLPKSSTTSALSSAGLVRLFGKVGDSINKMTYTMSEPDQWFEDKQEQIEALDQELKQLHASLEMLVIHRKELSLSIGQFAKSVAVLGSSEENMALSKALSSLADIETKVEHLMADQADTDFFVLTELVKDYINLIQSVKDTLNERVKLYKIWKDAETTLAKKRETKGKMEQQRKMDKMDLADQEIAEWEQRVTRSQESFDEISRNIRKELDLFERQKVRDFKSTVINYLQVMMNNQQQLASYWESFIPEAKLIA